MRENEPLAAKFRPVQLPHFKLLVFSNRDDVLKICVNCREANWARFYKFCRGFLIEVRCRPLEFPGSRF